jgi:DNA (cytosine-5)-methyltransferase 1
VLNTEKSGTLQAKPNGGFSHNYINPVVCRGFDMTAFGQYGNGEKSSTLKQRDYKDATDLCVETGKPPRKWIVRRLTPTECARLQGFPDMHGHPDHKDSLTDEEYAFWLNVRNTHAMINGRAQKQYTREQMLKWYNGLHTDSAEYKMWGNGIALPCAAFVLGQIARWAGDA